MSNPTRMVQFDQINEILDEDPSYLKEFCEAAIISFTSFRDDYTNSMRNRNLKELRKAGHRIKPAAKMVGVTQLIDEYKTAKKLLVTEASESKIEASIDRVQDLCEQVIADFNQHVANNK